MNLPDNILVDIIFITLLKYTIKLDVVVFILYSISLAFSVSSHHSQSNSEQFLSLLTQQRKLKEQACQKEMV